MGKSYRPPINNYGIKINGLEPIRLEYKHNEPNENTQIFYAITGRRIFVSDEAEPTKGRLKKCIPVGKPRKGITNQEIYDMVHAHYDEILAIEKQVKEADKSVLKARYYILDEYEHEKVQAFIEEMRATK